MKQLKPTFLEGQSLTLKVVNQYSTTTVEKSSIKAHLRLYQSPNETKSILIYVVSIFFLSSFFFLISIISWYFKEFFEGLQGFNKLFYKIKQIVYNQYGKYEFIFSKITIKMAALLVIPKR